MLCKIQMQIPNPGVGLTSYLWSGHVCVQWSAALRWSKSSVVTAYVWRFVCLFFSVFNQILLLYAFRLLSGSVSCYKAWWFSFFTLQNLIFLSNIKPSPTRWCHHFILYLINHKILTKTHWRSTTILQRFQTNFDADLATKTSLRIRFCFYFIMVSSLNGFVQVQLNIHSLLQRLPVVGQHSSWRYNLRLDNSGQTPALAATADSNRSRTGWVWSL